MAGSKLKVGRDGRRLRCRAVAWQCDSVLRLADVDDMRAWLGQTGGWRCGLGPA
jgi:hypothetical protein